jgi:peptide-methionine (S)-S-oxide reductase
VRGVRKVVSGYAGGERGTAHYDTVSTGSTGHAESVMITFDPAQIYYVQLLQIAFSVVHDPTQLNRQGPDVGTGYRSDIFYMSDEQRRIAQTYIAQLGHANVYPRPIMTRVDAFTKFNQVDLSQQDFMVKNPQLEYIEVNDVPKLASLKRLFPDAYRSLPLQYR